ncbi:hypothetical protein WP50_25335 [Lactiplantibacillus plantarum]|nr:hypothetical protein WP50_25335 [Lactiplantibacillus plantarum]
MKAVDTHIAGQHCYLITYQFGEQTATTWLNVQPSHEPIIPISRIPEYSAITRTINYQDERTGAVLAGPVIQNVRVVRFAIFNAKTHELLMAMLTVLFERRLRAKTSIIMVLVKWLLMTRWIT